MRQTLSQIEGRETFPAGNGTIGQTGAIGLTAICPCATAAAAGGALLAVRRLREEMDLGVRTGTWGGLRSVTATGRNCYADCGSGT